MKMSKAMLVAAILCGTLGSANAYAAEEPTPEFTLDAMVVTATRTEKKMVDTPANVNVVSAEEIEKKNYQSVRTFLA